MPEDSNQHTDEETIEALAEALDEAGVTPEELAEAVSGAEGGEVENEHDEKQAEEARKIMERSAEKLAKMMRDDKEAQMLSEIMMAGRRLSSWAIDQFSRHEGVDENMALMLYHSQNAHAREGFTLTDVYDSLFKRLKKFLGNKLKEARKEAITRQKLVRDLQARLRRDDIPLPFHSMAKAFKDDKFMPGSIMLVFGSRDDLKLVMRRCTQEYQRRGGVSGLLLASDEVVSTDIARVCMPPAWYVGATAVYISFMEIMEPLTRKIKISESREQRIGLLAVEDVHELCDIRRGYLNNDTTNYANEVSNRIAQLSTFAFENGIGCLIGIPDVFEDKDNEILSDLVFSPMLKCTAHVRVQSDGDRVVVGNDSISRRTLDADLKGENN